MSEPKEFSEELKGLAIKALETTELIQELTAQHILEHAEKLQAVKAKLQRLMSDEDVSKIDLEKGMILLSMRSGKILDKEALLKALGLPDLSTFEKQKAPVEVMSVKMKVVKEEE